MILKTKQFLKRFDTEDFKRLLTNVMIADDISYYRDRPENQTQWLEHKEGDVIFGSHIKSLMESINAEITARNEALKQSDKTYNVYLLEKGEPALYDPLSLVQELFLKYMSDDLPQFMIPRELRALGESSMLVLACRTALCRLPYNMMQAKLSNDVVTLNLKQVYKYFGDNFGKNTETNTRLDDLYVLRDEVIKKYAEGEKKIKVGVISSGQIQWFNNLYVTDITISEVDVDNGGDLTERPTNWTKNVGEDKSTTEKGNLSYVKNVRNMFDKDYDENIEWTTKQKTIEISVQIKHDPIAEELTSEYLKDSLITAERLNKFKEYTNKLTTACFCNCNYCTCDCNYCTCNCNYCTCNCNYCTCNCNYKSLAVEETKKQFPTITQYTRQICACDSNRREYVITGEYGNYFAGWLNYSGSSTAGCNCDNNYSGYWVANKYGTNYVAGCSTNRVFVANGKLIWQAPVAGISLSCVCQSNTKTNKFKTGWFSVNNSGNVVSNSKREDYDEIASTAPLFSTATTTGSGKIVETKKSSSSYQICTCDVNVNISNTLTKTYYDVTFSINNGRGPFYYKCSCNANTVKNPLSESPDYAYVLTEIANFATRSDTPTMTLYTSDADFATLYKERKEVKDYNDEHNTTRELPHQRLWNLLSEWNNVSLARYSIPVSVSASNCPDYVDGRKMYFVLAELAKSYGSGLQKGDSIPVFVLKSSGYNTSATDIKTNLATTTNVPTGKQIIEYKQAKCPSNRTTQTLVDWKMFWENTTYSAGKETK